MPYLNTDKLNFYYEIYGEGPPLLLIAGMSSDSQSWLSVISRLSRYFTLIITDNRGAGRTKTHDTAISIQKISDDHFELVKNLGYASIHVLGHSMGGFVALDFALRYPDLVNKLILESTSAFNLKRNNELNYQFISQMEEGIKPEKIYRDIFSWFFTERILNDTGTLNDLIEIAIGKPYRQSKIAFLNQTKAIEAFNCEQLLTKISKEVLIICGKEDKLFPPEESIKTLKAIPNHKIQIIERAAHSIHIENPEAFCNCVIDFLNGDNPVSKKQI